MARWSGYSPGKELAHFVKRFTPKGHFLPRINWFIQTIKDFAPFATIMKQGFVRFFGIKNTRGKEGEAT